MKYIVKYKDVTIGEYNQYDEHVEYIAYKEQIKRLEEKGIYVIPFLTENMNCRAFAYLDNRIKNSKKIGDVVIGYHTDPITLEEVKEI